MSEDLTPIKAGQWSLFTQLNGSNTEWNFLGCHDLDDLEQDLGDITIEFCPSQTRANKWVPVTTIQGEPGAATTVVTTNAVKAQGILSKATEAGCDVPFYIAEILCGKVNHFTNWESQVHILTPTTIINRGMQNLRKKSPTDQAVTTRSYGLSAPNWLEVFEVSVEELAIAETAGLTDIVFCNAVKCADACGQAEASCESGVVVGQSPAGSPAAAADLWSTANEGTTWTVRNPGPFPDGDDIASVVCFDIDKNTTRYLVANGSINAGAMTVAYRDGLTGAWTEVTVGAVNGQYALHSGALFALDSQHIWLVTTGGYIYFSDDGGVTWTAQSEADVTAQNLLYIHGSDSNNLFAVGVADTVLRTISGGDAWVTATATGGGGTNGSVNVLSRFKAWVGDGSGNLYFTNDGGTTWTARTNWTGSGTGAIPDIAFVNDLVGWMLYNDGTGAGTNSTIYRTINGGYNWQALTDTPTNTEMSALAVCGNNLAYAVGGNPNTGAAVILKASNA